MFEGPEYASYIALCRKLRLEREFDDGDYYTAPVPVSVIAPEGYEVLIWVGLFRLPRATEACVWLPLLHQWLEMLEKAGADCPSFDRADEAYILWRFGIGLDEDDPRGEGPSREEAAARLWCAVTGQFAPA